MRANGLASRTMLHAVRFTVFSALLCLARSVTAHPLGNFTINHFTRIAVGIERVSVHYVVDMAEIPTFQELQGIGTSRDAAPGRAALDAYAGRMATQYADGLVLTVDSTRVPLQPVAERASLPPGAGGRGKTVVGAYLVGARGTAPHAAFLGLTVTITHTLGVFALGVVTLCASQYVLPERLFPVLSFLSGAIVLLIGLGLFVTRVRVALGARRDDEHDHHHPHAHDHHDAHHQHHHSHVPPEPDGSTITWRSLLALGVSGGILPCPSALVVLLSAVALHRVGFGVLLIVAFSAGLAGALTAVGLAFVYAGRFLKRPAGAERLVRVLPVFSALVITGAGAGICYAALRQAGVDVEMARAASAGQVGLLSTASVLGLGLVFGLKHALDADHVAALSTIVAERKSVFGSSMIGALWGVGHTISLLAAGVAVIVMHLQIGVRVALALEFCVAIMLIGLGANALYKVLRGGRIHLHAHQHGGRVHLHPHIHDGAPEPEPRAHHGVGSRLRPLVVGMVHGLAGSAALMLLVLTTIPSPLVSFAYLVVFGVGSIGGMMLTTAVMGLPVQLTATRFTHAHRVVRTVAGVFSIGCGLLMACQIGFVDKLFV